MDLHNSKGTLPLLLPHWTIELRCLDYVALHPEARGGMVGHRLPS